MSSSGISYLSPEILILPEDSLVGPEDDRAAEHALGPAWIGVGVEHWITLGAPTHALEAAARLLVQKLTASGQSQCCHATLPPWRRSPGNRAANLQLDLIRRGTESVRGNRRIVGELS